METLFLALRVAVALGAVLGLIWLVQRKMTRGSGRKASIASRLSSRRPIQVVGTHRLGAKASISVVEIDGRRMVLGVTEHGITVLEAPATPEAPVSAAPADLPDATDEASLFTGDSVAASAGDALASPAEPRPVTPDVAFALRLALEEVAEPAAPAAAAHVAPARRRRRVAIPNLDELLPHLSRVAAAAIGIGPRPTAGSRPAAPARSVAPARTAPPRSATRPTDSLSLPSASEHPPARAAAAPAVAVPPRATPARVDRATAGADPGFAAMLAAASRPTPVAPARASAFGPAASLDSLDDEPARPLVAPIPASVASRSFSGAVPLASRLPVLHRAS